MLMQDAAPAAGPLKEQVRAFWDKQACGEVYLHGADARERFEAQARARYALEPYLRPFARFEDGAGKDVLEIGVGLGADHLEWAKSKPRSLTGVDITERAIEQTRERFDVYGFSSELRVADAENLPFANDAFDLVYSYGVLHHTPDTARAIDEVWRVLRPGGTALIMIYHAHSLVGGMLWLRHALLAGRPLRSLAEVYAQYLESPGTKAFTREQAAHLFRRFRRVNLRPQLSHGDLLEGSVGQRHASSLLTVARAIWPRRLLKALCRDYGLALLIEAKK